MSNLTCHSNVTINFPMVCLLRHYEGSDILEMHDALSKLILKLESENRGIAASTYTQGGYHTTNDFIHRQDHEVVRFREQVLFPGVQEYMQHYYRYKFTKQIQITDKNTEMKGWGNVMRKGEWNAPHNHTALYNRLSAVYYIKVPKCKRPEGALQFDNPNSIGIQHGDYGNIKFHPTEGDLIIFPCYQMHFSHPFYTEGERILIASDIKIDDCFNASEENNFISLNMGGS